MTAPAEIRARIEVSRSRYWLTLAAIVALVLVLAGLAVDPGLGALMRSLFAALALALAALAAALLARGRGGLTLTEDGLRDDAGHEVCTWSAIRAVNRGLSPIRPSKGFLIYLNAPAPRGWHPGLWWRWGTRIGVGGMVAGRQASFMADLMTLHLKIADGTLQLPEDPEQTDRHR